MFDTSNPGFTEHGAQLWVSGGHAALVLAARPHVVAMAGRTAEVWRPMGARLSSAELPFELVAAGRAPQGAPGSGSAHDVGGPWVCTRLHFAHETGGLIPADGDVLKNMAHFGAFLLSLAHIAQAGPQPVASAGFGAPGELWVVHGPLSEAERALMHTGIHMAAAARGFVLTDASHSAVQPV